MIILISGATHTGKTFLAQKIMERYKIPYYSIDHIKMGLIRSGQTKLSVSDDEKLTPYLWAIVKGIIKTAVENKQSLILEGCYIPFDWKKDFDETYLNEIKYVCLVMSQSYVENNFSDILKFENVIEKRLAAGDSLKEELLKENERNLQLCKKYNLNYILIDGKYEVDFEV